MARKPQKCAKDGSQKWLQLTVNEFPNLLSTLVAEQLHPTPSTIEWLSPLRNDEFAEYSDEDFINLLGVTVKICSLKCFWPPGGPFWDALGKTDRSQVLIVEAKSYIGEMRGQGSGASNPKSIRKISRSLKKTQEFLGGSESADWLTRFR